MSEKKLRILEVNKAYHPHIGGIETLVKQYSEAAYRLARHQLGNTDLDIISSAVGVQNICVVCILATGGGKMGLVRFFDAINGHNTQNEAIAEIRAHGRRSQRRQL